MQVSPEGELRGGRGREDMCEDRVLEYTPLHGASCSLSSALDRVCIRTRELADRAQDMRGGGDSEAD